MDEAQRATETSVRLEKTLCDLHGLSWPTMLWTRADMEELHRLLLSAAEDCGTLIEQGWH